MQKGDSQGPHIQKMSCPPPATIADEMLFEAYLCTREQDMRAAMERIVEVCLDTQDRHFARKGLPPLPAAISAATGSKAPTR